MSLQDQALSALKQATLSRLPTQARQALNIGSRIADRFSPKFSGSSGKSSGALSAIRSRADPLMSFNWRCDLPIIDNSFKLGWEYVEEATLPFVEFEKTSNYKAGKMSHYPHHYSLSSLSLKLYEDKQGKSVEYLNQWKKLIIDGKTGLYNVPKVYKKPIKITIYDSALSTVMFLTYLGCWVERHDTFALSGDSQRINPSVEFSVDDIEVSFGKFEAGKIPSIIDKIGSEFPLRITDLPNLFPNNFIKFNTSSFF